MAESEPRMSRHGLRPALRPRGFLLQAIRPLWRELAIKYYRRALKEISPLHPDVPHIVHRLRALLDERGPEPIKAFWRWC